VAEETIAILQTKAWLVARTGPLAGTRYLLREDRTQVGRSAENDIVLHGPNTATVSGQHLEIRGTDGAWRILDTGSTNGTYVNGQRIVEADLSSDTIIRLGNDGPEFGFTIEEVAPSELDSTLVIPQGILLPALPTPPASQPDADGGGHDDLLSDAVDRARQARMDGGHQTMTLMRDVLQRALRRHSCRFRITIWCLLAAIACISAGGLWKITRLKSDKAAIDGQIREIEIRLSQSQGTPEQTDRLISRLDAYADEAQNLQHSLFYRVGGGQTEDFVTQQIRQVMAEFGAEVYSIPPDFVDRVKEYVDRYQGPDRPLMAHPLTEANGQIAIMQRVLKEQKLPPDFAYLPIVESALAPHPPSTAGAAGPWQFTAATARAYGLGVDGAVDERLDIAKSTRAASGFLRQLLLDFGTGSSVMLALAAYNLGPSKVKQAVVKSVEDPIKQRNFWYLYRARALPVETREFVPKVFAAIVVGRNPQHFGFGVRLGNSTEDATASHGASR
jgi:membrane-bound lytic murein transglycosylase D